MCFFSEIGQNWALRPNNRNKKYIINITINQIQNFLCNRNNEGQNLSLQEYFNIKLTK